MLKCSTCPEPAETHFTWRISIGEQRANFCGACAAMWWNKYFASPSAPVVTIDDPQELKDGQAA